MKQILSSNESYTLKRGVNEIDLTNAVVGLTVNSSAATVSNGVADLGNVVKSNASGTLIWVGNQSQYDSIQTKDPNTLYFITGATS